ncbi:hypothetical protein [Haloarcula argentinensis]|uniref:Sulfatase N-terminal domain-containing protein n=1 Tax=Haloarcula argentinensis TaxID=43776 RepID=A0ABU2F673_HALAR|nr:hypothetical protein [Haloarcula argentinensis]MDS0256029.1 hypothetical protein [Haloarcula argentinensis]
MYSDAALRKALSDPVTVAREMRRILNHRGEAFNQTGVDIFSEDWDNLIILDACRADFLAEALNARDIENTFSTIQSRGSATFEWVRGNFMDRSLDDTVYVSASSWYLKLKDEINSSVHDFVPVIGEEYREPPVDAIPPHYVTEAARDAANKYPHKRLLIHYVQPHMPYLGQKGVAEFPEARHKTVREMMLDKDGDREKQTRLLKEAYMENLDIVLDDVEQLASDLSGKTIVSADHGEFLGERPNKTHPFVEFGHPVGFRDEPIIEVPWVELPYEERRAIQSDAPSENEAVSEEEINEQLRALGYKQ